MYACVCRPSWEVFTSVPANGWGPVSTKEQCDKDYPYLPERIIDQILSSDAKVSIINWNDFYPYYPDKLEILINNAYNHRSSCKYNLSRPMCRKNLI